MQTPKNRKKNSGLSAGRGRPAALKIREACRQFAADTPQLLEILFKTIADRANCGIAISDLTGKVLYANKCFARMHGRRPDTVAGCSIVLFHSAEQMERVTALMQRLRCEGSFTAEEVWHIRSDGSVFPTMMNAFTITDNRRRPLFWATTAIDITEYKRTAQEIRQGKTFLESVFDATGDGIVVADKAGHIVRVNKAIIKMLGYTEAYLQGKHAMGFVPEGYVPGVDAGAWLKHGFVNDYRSQWRRSDGSAAHIAMNIRAIKDDQGATTGWVAAVRDITEQQKAENEIAEAKKFLENIFKAAGDGILVTDADGYVIQVNQAMEAMLGYTQAELSTMHIRDLWPEGFAPAPKLQQLFGEGSVNNYESLWRRKDGTVFPIETNIALFKDAAGRVKGGVSSVRDITARKRAEAALRESEERFRSIAESTSDAIILADKTGRIIFWNEGARRLYGYTAQEVLRKPAWILNADRKEAKNRFQKFLTTGVATTAGKTVETTGCKKDGSRFPAEITTAVWKRGGGAFVSAIIRDVTERKHAEQQIKDSEKKYRQLYESLRDGCIAAAMDKSIVECNAAFKAMLGYTDNELCALSYEDITPQRWHAREARIVKEQVLRRGYSDFYEKEYIRKNGSVFPVEMRTYLTRDEHGRPAGLWAFARDITERQKAQEALRESEERFRAIAETTPDAIVTIDSRGTIIYCNQSATKIYGYTQQEALGKPVHTLVPEHLKGSDERALRTMLKKKASPSARKPVESCGLKKDGTEFPIESSFSVWRSKENVFSSAIIRDITVRKHAEEMLSRTNQCLASFGPDAETNIRHIVENAGRLSQGACAALIARKGGRAGDVQAAWNMPQSSARAAALKELLRSALRRDKHKNAPVGGYASRFGSCTKKDRLFREYGMMGWLSAPVTVHGQKVGWLCAAFRTARAFYPHECELFAILAKALGIEVERKQVVDELRANQQKLQVSEKHLKEFSGKILSIREDEKKNLSMNLHDELGSLAVSLGSMLSIAEEDIRHKNKREALASLSWTKAVLERSISRLKEIAADLRPADLDILGLPDALKDYVEGMNRQAQVSIEFKTSVTREAIPAEAAIIFYRVAQEAITNIIKHARASRASLKLFSRDNTLHFSIRDNGRGFNAEKVLQRSEKVHLGIRGMKERVESIGGSFEVVSQLREGSRITIRLPYRREG